MQGALERLPVRGVRGYLVVTPMGYRPLRQPYYGSPYRIARPNAAEPAEGWTPVENARAEQDVLNVIDLVTPVTFSDKIGKALVDSFITPIEREDIETLSNALYKIPKTVEKFAERINLAPEQVRGLDFSRQTALIELAVETLVTMVRGLRRPDLEQVKSLNDRLQQLEGDADKAVLELLREVYQGQHPASKTVLLKDLFDLLEKVIDRCRDAGNVVTHIVLKNS